MAVKQQGSFNSPILLIQSALMRSRLAMFWLALAAAITGCGGQTSTEQSSSSIASASSSVVISEASSEPPPLESYWVGTWTTAPQLVEPQNNPPAPGLTNNTLRQVLKVSIGGSKLRMRFSNEFTSSPVTLKSVYLAKSSGGSGIDSASQVQLMFNGQAEVTMQGNDAVYSDEFSFDLAADEQVAVTIAFGQTAQDVTGHPGSRTTSYIAQGDATQGGNFTATAQTDHWYVINNMEVMATEPSAAVAIIGDSITDGRGSGTNMQNRWPDELSKLLHANPATVEVGVLNQGIGGNCVTQACLGPSALDRFERDVLNQEGVKWVIIFEGINDIGNSGDPNLANSLTNAYQTMIDAAKAKGLKVYGATMLNFKGSSYDTGNHESIRQQVNEWIRTSGEFDAVIDLEAALADPNDPTALNPAGDDGDHLHPNQAGHRMMAEAVDLNLFVE